MDSQPEDSDSHLLNIGEVARRAGVSSRTIRYYEELGILPEPPRSDKGTRKYPPSYVSHLRWALTLKQLDFTLDEVRVIAPLGLGAELDSDESAAVSDLIGQRLADLSNKVEVLRKLEELAANGTRADPAIIESLQQLVDLDRPDGAKQRVG